MKLRMFAFMVLVLATIHTTVAQTTQKEHKIVFHLASSDTLVHKALVKQISNVLEYWKNAKIEVVIHNNGIGFMIKNEAHFAKEIEVLRTKGIIFAVCQNTMKARKLNANQILEGALFVPVGIAEIVEKEEAGWSYIKAGF